MDLLIYCLTKPGVKAWTLKTVLAPTYLKTYAIKKVLSHFGAK